MLPGTAMAMWKQARLWIECVDYEVILSGIVGPVGERSFSSNAQVC
jgi:hypothetical protein